MDNLEACTELAFTITEQDAGNYYTDYRDYYRKANRRWKRQEKTYYVRYYLSLILIPGAVSVSVYQLTEQIWLFFLALVLSATLWQRALTKRREWHYRRMLKRLCASPGFIDEHCMKISPEGLSDRTDYSAWTVFWPYVHDIVVGKHNILFVTGDLDDPRITPIPRHAFANQEDAKQFVEQAGAFWKGTLAVSE